MGYPVPREHKNAGEIFPGVFVFIEWMPVSLPAGCGSQPPSSGRAFPWAGCGHPAVGIAVEVHERWLAFQRLIAFNHFSGHGHIQRTDGLQGFHRPEFVIGSEGSARIGQIDEQDFAKLILCEIRDADDQRVAVLAGPYVAGRVTGSSGRFRDCVFMMPPAVRRTGRTCAAWLRKQELGEHPGGFVQPFRKGRVGMDGFKEIPCRAPLLKGKGCFGDEIRGVRPGNVNAEEFACAFFGNDFEESGKRAHSLRLAEFPELENRRADRYPLLSGLLFRQSHIADFRRSKNGRRNHRIRLYLFFSGCRML